jgi:amino-acid N-acetyltransferase
VKPGAKSSSASRFVIRKARMEDARPVHTLLNYFAERRELLPRSLSEIYENLQQFFVVMDGSRVVGSCALYVTWSGLAEVKALAVHPDFQGKGLGKRLLQTIVQEAKNLGVDTLFTLTIREGLFKKFGFRRVKKSALPHKVWTECVRCPYFPDTCVETSLVLRLGKGRVPKSQKDLAASFMATSEPMVPSEPLASPIIPSHPPKSR